MSRNRLILEGMVQFKQELRQTPTHLVTWAREIVQEEGEAAIQAMRMTYPAKTGNLRRGLSLAPAASTGPFTAAVLLRNRAPHAMLFEFGTQIRQGAGGSELGRGSRRGNALANRGAMPPGHVFIPARERANRRVTERVRQLLEAYGFQVSGDAR